MIRKRSVTLLITVVFVFMLQGSSMAAEIDGGEGGTPFNITDSEGRFAFENVTGDSHVVWVDGRTLPERHRFDDMLRVTVSASSNASARSGKMILEASLSDSKITGRLYADLNDNTIFDDGDEPLAGVSIFDPPEIRFLIISWPTEAGQLIQPVKNIMQKHPEITIKVRNTDQARMNLTETEQLIEWADIVYISNVQTTNGPSGPVPDLLMSMKSQGKLNGKVIAAYPNPYHCFPVTRLTNINNTRFVDANGTELTDSQLQAIFDSVSRAVPPKTPLMVLRELQQQYPAMASYLKFQEYKTSDTASPENREQGLMYLLALAFPGRGYNFTEPVIVPKYALYRNGRLYYNFTDYEQFLTPGRPTVGITSWMALTWERGDLLMLDRLISEMESRGINVIATIAQGNPVDGTPVINAMRSYFFDSQNRTRIQGLITLQSFKIGGATAAIAERMIMDNNILVFRSLVVSDSEETWYISDSGMDFTSITSQIVLPEFQGQILTMVTASTRKTIDTVTGLEVECYQPIDERVETFADRVYSWLRLRFLSNADKKVALIYYNYPPGKQNLAGASYLDGPSSILEILGLLQENNYTVRGAPSCVDDLLTEMMARGLNIANWAPGELERLANSTILWDVERYMEWYSRLPELARREIEEGPFGYIEALFRYSTENPKLLETLDRWQSSLITTIDDMQISNGSEAKNQVNRAYNALKNIYSGLNQWDVFYSAKSAFLALRVPGLCGWGAPPGNIMTVERNGKRYLVIPGMFYGNVFVGPQPQRGWEGDVDKLYHSQIVPPHHQYLAFYAYLQTEFGADAMIHLGRHGTYEWLPRKESALSGADYPDICLGGIPSIYIYIMDGVGEVIHAKRRGLAVSISHLTPPLEATEIYGDIASLKTLIDQYHAAPGNRSEEIRLIREKAVQLHLDTIIDLNLDPDELVDRIDDYIRELEGTMMPLGLYVFGRDLNQTQLTIMVKSMASVPRISAGNNTFLSVTQALSGINRTVEDLILEFYSGKSLQTLMAELQAVLGRNLTATEITALNMTLNDVLNIKGSGARERQMLLQALAGGYIPPIAGGDPIRNPAAVPTGGNLYGEDPSLLPTQAAWIRGSMLADEALRAYNATPEQLGVVIWATETQNDKGATVAFILRLMGLEPIYGFGGSVMGVRATPLTVLNRSRVDVLMTTSGIFRETFPLLGVLLDRASRVALAASFNTLMAAINQESAENRTMLLAALNASVSSIQKAGLFIPGSDPLDRNPIARHWLYDVKELIKLGMKPEDAGIAAISRLFGPSLGNYGTRLPEAVQQDWTWEERTELGRLYIDSMKYALSEDGWGVSLEEVLTMRLRDVEGVYHSRSTNLYGVVDVDHNFEFLGGFRLAVEAAGGRVPGMYIINQVNPSNARIETLNQFLYRELQSRYYNPRWIQAMMQSGYAGAREISNNFVANLWGWNVMSPETISDWMWEETVDIYIRDRYGLGVKDWLSQGRNSYAMISMTGTMLTAIHRGYWNPDDATKRLIATTWAQAIAENGVACCDCSCGNIAMMEWAMQYLNPDLLSRVREKLYAATKSSAFAPSSDGGSTPTAPSNPGQPQAPGTSADNGEPHHEESQDSDVSTSAPGVEAATHSSAGENQGKAYEVSSASGSANPETGLPVYAIVGIVAIVGLLGLGYFFGPGRTD
ncbi:cobaltochelatase subunit CobN [Methanothermobacter thermautotrophicus]|uniref:cobaltochelatase subunit CobN n=1 Tax=Methanothermobacter thermautotrophicus TaxID=145262 RepID=UPI003D7F3F99